MKWASLIVLIYCLPYGADPWTQPGVVFYHGFEGTKQEISDAWGSPAAGEYSVADPGPFDISGNKVLKVGADGSVIDVRKFLQSGYDRLYARWYQKWDAGYDWTKSDHQGFIFSSGLGMGAAYVPDGCKNGVVWMQLEPNHVPDNAANGVHWYVYHPGKTTPWGDVFPTNTAPALSSNQWHRIEAMVDLGTPTPSENGANGVLDLWVDGTHYGPNTCSLWPNRCGGSWFRSCDSLKIRLIEFMGYTRADWVQPGISIYYDDLVVSTQPISSSSRVPYYQVPLRIGTDTLKTATVGASYSVFPSAAGGVTTYSWQIAGGVLPPGLSLVALTGNIKGTPTQAGTYSFTLRVTDKSVPAQTADKQLSIRVNPSTNIAGLQKAASAVTAQVRSNRLQFRFSKANVGNRVRLFDATGRMVWEQRMENSNAAAESPVLQNGLYLGQVQSGDQNASFRFTVLK